MTSLEQNPAADISLVYVIGRLNHGIRREMRRELAEWQLSVPEFTTLTILQRRPGLSNAQLGRRTMVTPQSMIEILSGLATRGLVERSVDPNHGRILRAELTAEGEWIVMAALPKIDAVQDRLLEGVSDQQRELVLGVMLQAMQRLQHAQ